MRGSAWSGAALAVLIWPALIQGCAQGKGLNEAMEDLHHELLCEHVAMGAAQARMEAEERGWLEVHRRVVEGKPDPEHDRICDEHARLLETHRSVLKRHREILASLGRLERAYLRGRAAEVVVRNDREQMEAEHRSLIEDHRRMTLEHERIQSDHLRMLDEHQKQ